jgi:tetratricopeptide (TPR) repeat protein
VQVHLSSQRRTAHPQAGTAERWKGMFTGQSLIVAARPKSSRSQDIRLLLKHIEQRVEHDDGLRQPGWSFVRRSVGWLGAAMLLAPAPAYADWYEAQSKHFVIYADEAPNDLQNFATQVEKFDKAVRKVREMDDPPVGDAGKVTIYILKSANAVSSAAVGKRSPIAGFYIPRASGSVAFVSRNVGDGTIWSATADTILFHEYAHHLMFQNTDAVLPAWLVEGFAEFFSTAEFERNGSVRLGMPATHRAAALYRPNKPNIRNLLTTSVKDDASSEEFDRFYGRAWLLTHYLTFAPSRSGQLARYLGEVRTGTELLKAAQDSFGDLNTLDRDLDRYLEGNRFKYIVVNSPDLNNIAVALRPLRAGESAMMAVRMRSARGVDSKDAHAVAELARKVAASYPNDPAVERELAEAEFDQQDYAASEKAASSALAEQPNFVKALIYKGRAEMALADGDRHANWDAIRRIFMAANKLDTENPEPLLRYYESFGRSGTRPTANAIAGLEYALVLAPQDRSLRMMVVSEEIDSGKFADARATLAPLAFDPHSGKQSELARKLMAALSSKDPRTAIGLMAQAGDLPQKSRQ